jgi:hypothetical protein
LKKWADICGLFFVGWLKKGGRKGRFRVMTLSETLKEWESEKGERHREGRKVELGGDRVTG